MRAPHAGTAHPRRTALATLSLAIAGVIAVLGVTLGQHVSLSLAYVVPIGIMSWYVGLTPALLLSMACALDWLLLGTTSGHPETTPGAPIWSSFVELGFFSIIAFTLAALQRSLEHQRTLATTDDVTGAPNRRSFYERAALELERMRRSGGPLTLVFLDLDAFKGVNDRFGHRAGDELLRIVARTLREGLRAVDFVARLGGDEYAILLPDTDEEAARTVLEKLRDELNAVFRGGGWPVTSSAGAVTFQALPVSIDSALAEADALLYAVKATGKNGVAHRSFDTRMPASVATRSAAADTRR